jgi:hypothetical protein
VVDVLVLEFYSFEQSLEASRVEIHPDLQEIALLAHINGFDIAAARPEL